MPYLDMSDVDGANKIRRVQAFVSANVTLTREQYDNNVIIGYIPKGSVILSIWRCAEDNSILIEAPGVLKVGGVAASVAKNSYVSKDAAVELRAPEHPNFDRLPSRYIIYYIPPFNAGCNMPSPGVSGLRASDGTKPVKLRS